MKTQSFILAAFAAAPCFAQTSEPPTALDPIVVTATRSEARLNDTLASVIVITREQIERSQSSDIAELLRFYAGLEIGRNGGVGQVTSIFTRGGNSNHTLVLVDGVAINPGSGFGAAVQNISPELIERIEVVKGPRSTLYGSSAIAGVINIITRKSATGTGAALTLRGGADETRVVAGEVAAGDGNAQLNLRAESYRSDGYPVFAGQPTLERGVRRESVNLAGGSQLGPVALELRGWRSAGRAEYVSFGTPGDQDFTNNSAQVELSAQPAAAWSSQFSVSRSADAIDQNQPNFLGDLDYLRSARPRAEWFNQFTLSKAMTLSAGLSYENDKVDTLSFGTRLNDQQSIRSLVLQDELHFGAHRAVLGLSHTDHEAFGGHATWNAEYGYELFIQTRLIASAGSGFRAPSVSERFGFGGNPDLQPEQSRSFELGLRQGIGSNWNADLRLFRNEVDDLINSVCVSLCGGPNFFDDVFQNRNVNETRNDGGELALNADYAALSGRLSYLRQNPRSLTSATGAPNNGRELLRRAKDTLSGSLSARLGRYRFGMDALGSGKRADFGQALPGYAVVNLTAAAELGRHFTLKLRGENVLDKNYQTAFNYNMPGAQGFLSVDWRY